MWQRTTKFTPSAVVLTDSYDSSRIDDEVNFNAIETGLYVEDEVKFTSKLKGLLGVRLSSFHVDGANYINPEPRVALAYKLAKNLSAKLSYATMNQYIHLLSSSGVGLPTDLWVPATKRVKPPVFVANSWWHCERFQETADKFDGRRLLQNDEQHHCL